MGWSKEWETLFQTNNKHLTIWPWSDLVAHVKRNVQHITSETRILEMGCGPGANIPFFQSLGAQYYAIEGSESVVNRLHKNYPNLKDQIVVGDFTESIPFEGQFDIIVDRASITHNSTKSIVNCLEMVYNKLIVGGHFIGIDWFSTEHTEFINGVTEEDPFTISSISKGHLAETGRVHFANQEHLEGLFHRFSIKTMEHKLVKRIIPNDNSNIIGTWNLVAVKEK